MYYHGSTIKNLKNLIFSKETSRFGSIETGNLVHGEGIYLTRSIEEAKGYATTGSVYEISVSGHVFDTTSKSELLNFVELIEKELGLDQGTLLYNDTITTMINRIIDGTLSGVCLNDHLSLLIGNDEYLYSCLMEVNEDIDTHIDSINDLFQKYSLIKINHKNSDWIICRDHDGYGLEITNELDPESI